MDLRAAALITAFSAIAAHAQELDLSGFRPTIATPEVEVIDAGTVAESLDAGSEVVESEKALQALPAASEAVEQGCTTKSGCPEGLVCSSYRSLGQGKWVGACRPPKLLKPATDAGPERFRYLGAVPRGFHMASERRWGVIGLGLGLFMLGYLPQAMWGLAVNEPRSLIPGVGPFYLASKVNLGGFIDGRFLMIFFAMVDVSVQVAGLFWLITGLASPRLWLERDDAKPQVTIVPGAAGAPLGASVVGRF